MIPVLYDIQTSRQRPTSIVILWRYAMTQPVAAARVKLFRSYAPNDGFTELADVPLADGMYQDDSLPALDVNRTVYYSLQVNHPDGSRTYGPVFVRDRVDRFQMYVTRRMNLYLSVINARPVLIYQPAYGEEASRCPNCWDTVTKQVVVSNCRECAGTSYIGTISGYYNPILTLVDILPPPKRREIDDTAYDPSVTTARMSNYPILRPNDVLREMHTGRMWKATSVVPQVKDVAVLTQDPIMLREIQPGDIEHVLPVPDTVRPLLTRKRAQLERMVIEDENGITRVLEVLV